MKLLFSIENCYLPQLLWPSYALTLFSYYKKRYAFIITLRMLWSSLPIVLCMEYLFIVGLDYDINYLCIVLQRNNNPYF